jgi:mono/diheme cytochrome c family protein
VEYLAHPNGWWRDTAQKLLVLRQDTSIAPALHTIARTSANQLARIHALWTLEGLHALDASLARELMKAGDAQIRIQAIRASESLYKSGDASFAADYLAMTHDPDPNVVIQAMLTMNVLKAGAYVDTIRALSETSTARGVREIGRQILSPAKSLGQGPSLLDTGAGPMELSTDERRSLLRGERIYRELCTVCHGADGRGAPLAGGSAGDTMAPPLAQSSRIVGNQDYAINVLLHGLTGPLEGKTYSGGVMVPMGGNTDEWIADVSSFIRNSFGNRAPLVTPERVAAARVAHPRTSPWTLAELQAALAERKP